MSTDLPKKLACPLIVPAGSPGGDLRGSRQTVTRPRSAAYGSIKNKQQNSGIKTMAADRAQNLQDTFLNHVRKTKTPLTIFLVNGVKLQGIVTWFDNFCLLLRRDG